MPRWWIHVGTIRVGRYRDFGQRRQLKKEFNQKCEHALLAYQHCVEVSGVVETFAHDDMQKDILICHTHKKNMTDLVAHMQKSFWEFHDVKGPSIQEKVLHATAAVDFAGRSALVPAAFSPPRCILKDAITPEEESLQELYKIVNQHLQAQPVPFSPGKNSRSKAKFFYSLDRELVIKMVRKEEYDVLWGLAKDCTYHRRLSEDGMGSLLDGMGSLLNQILLALTDSGQHWIIMRAEKLPSVIEQLLPEGSWRRDFHLDIKPGNMVSDREALALAVMQERMLMGGYLAPGMDTVLANLEKDLVYIDSKGLIDYSLLLYGSVLRRTDDDDSYTFFSSSKRLGSETKMHKMRKRWLEEMVEMTPNCGMQCSTRPANLIDVSGLLDASITKHLDWHGVSYQCCCFSLRPGDSALMQSPCVLVQVESGAANSGCGRFGKRFHSYHRPSVGGRCLVEMRGRGGWAPWHDFHFLDPAVLARDRGNYLVPGEVRVQSCTLMCAAIIDYLMEKSFVKHVEEIGLAPWYGEKKWTDYGEKTLHLLKCVVGGEPPLDAEDSQGSLLETLLAKSPPWHNPQVALSWNDCMDVFPTFTAEEDAAVVKNLVVLVL